MEPRYYLALFNEQSWKEFLSKGGQIYGTLESRMNRAKKIIPGDYLVCYISKRSIFSGVLKVGTKVYYDDSEYWTNGVFPVRFHVTPEVLLPIENGLSVYKFHDALEIFKNLKNKYNWSGFFINSFNEFPKEDAKYIVNMIEKKASE